MPWVYPISFLDWLDDRKDRRKSAAATTTTTTATIEPDVIPTSSTPNTATPSTISFAAFPSRSNATPALDRSLEHDLQIRFGSHGALASVPVSRSGSTAPSASSSSLALPRSLEQRVAMESRSFDLLGEVSLGARVLGERRRSMRMG
ncbi:hypothetical protein LTR91_011408 [Friedmanniomyces endolithicus]|uniref:Uncharacterized protein n=1 Tax=Friedmanniomyces endolithicus TaxID=329885 RepID=A0A4U0UGN7_9PEZI|nr:hypothetical protein LTS09_010003 [Friedmanniomyces endolithicus]KAK0267331.1 hypothetical protein LTR35_016395 [Friedmanniomyces endolithicus]KAK0274565.1 hypothetical protein LTS00_015383 [Friedmanniomyces endolithicus]KAK0303754.1 hypothetical protein LTR01_007840 [Friedmanniomyces endolithicus]KAK0313994.1 hypothetical protein LTR82_013304 [Friedmanniomyces endolithicus]